MRYAYTLIVALAFVSCIGNGADRSGNRSSGEAAAVEIFTFDHASLRDTLDLGTLREGETARREVRLVNNDTIPRVIISADMSCNCMTLDYKRTPVKPNEAAVIALEYDSKGQYGIQFKNISIQMTGDSLPRRLYVTCKVVK